MAKKKTARQIVQESMPAVRVMPPLSQPAIDKTTTTLPSGTSAQELRRKYHDASPEDKSADVVETRRSPPRNSSNIDELRRHFLGTAVPSASDASAVEDTNSDDVEIVRVQSRSEADNAASGPGVRAVIVSKSQGKIIGKQG